jgi:hypothetical protein
LGGGSSQEKDISIIEKMRSKETNIIKANFSNKIYIYIFEDQRSRQPSLGLIVNEKNENDNQ